MTATKSLVTKSAPSDAKTRGWKRNGTGIPFGPTLVSFPRVSGIALKVKILLYHSIKNISLQNEAENVAALNLFPSPPFFFCV